ncbi:MAG: hypothetical protein HQL14_02925 [Candidatus Omnitrophica bacterium]|nr:hypothetical protein [Candidatus Omnitrophota bacterium]
MAIHLVLKANHEAKTIVFNGQLLQIERGQCVCGRDVLAFDLGVNSSLITRKLKILQNLGFINVKSNNRYSVITVLNYDTYQDIKTKDEQPIGQPIGQQTNSQRTADRTQTTIQPLITIKNKMFKPPTVEEVTVFCQQRNSPVIPTAFIDFYASKGWMVGKNKMKDWKAACRNAEAWDRWKNNSGDNGKDSGRWKAL